MAAVEDIVSEHQAGAVVTYEFAAYDEGLRESVRRRLLCIAEIHAEIAAVTKQALESWQVLGSGYYEYVPDPGEH